MQNESKHADKHIIYQMMFHLWGNQNDQLVMNGSCEENGVTKFKDVSDKGLKALAKKGMTHLYATGILEHATMEDLTAFGSKLDHPSVVKGRAGSPFAIKDYYDVNPFLASNPKNRMAEFSEMLNRIHHQGLKFILDFVPNHLARQYFSDQKPNGVIDFGVEDHIDRSFDAQNNFYYLPGTQLSVPEIGHKALDSSIPYIEIPAKVSGNNIFSAQPSINDWFETVKLNYGVNYQHNGLKHFDPIPNTWLKMLDVLTYWTKKGVDGYRCDMAEMVPVEFWAFVIPKIKEINKEVIFIAEIYQPERYADYIFKAGFDYLYDKVGLYDAVRRLMENNPSATTGDITKVWQNESGNFSNRMLRFLENHDETRLNSPGFAATNFWSTIPGMVITATLHSGPLMIYSGQEFGEKANEIEGFNQADDRTTMFDFWRVDTHQRWLNKGKFDGALLTEDEKEIDHFYQQLIQFTLQSESISFGQFFDLQYAQNSNYSSQKVFSYLRYTANSRVLIICNFDALNGYDIDILIPELACKMMGIKEFKFKLNRFFVPPNVNQIPKMDDGKFFISPNSAFIIDVI